MEPIDKVIIRFMEGLLAHTKHIHDTLESANNGWLNTYIRFHQEAESNE